MPYDRIMMLGSGGSGKTTVARQIAERTGLPLIHLDRVFWNADWTCMPWEDFKLRLEELSAEERWVMDGHFGSLYDIRLRRADLAVFLDINPFVCLWRVFKRYGEPRPDMPDGMARDRIFRLHNFSFWLNILMARTKERSRVLKLSQKFPDAKFVVLRNDREIEAFLSSL